MKYALYEAVDTRDNKPMLWLHDIIGGRVALFHIKTAPSRIKQRTAAAPEGITWDQVRTFCNKADVEGAKLLDKWEFSL